MLVERGKNGPNLIATRPAEEYLGPPARGDVARAFPESFRMNKPFSRTKSSAPVVAYGVESLEDRRLFSLAIQFDYRYDASGFFKDQNRRDVLSAAAASVTARLNDTFAAITPSGDNTWSVTLRNPSSGTSTTIENPSVPDNKIVVFVGARDLEGTTLGQGGPTGWSATGTTAWTKLVRGRGQSGATDTPRTDFAPKTGAIAFDSPTSWYFGKTTGGLTSNLTDFFSVAAHELGHVLGIGAGSETWTALASGGAFHGPKSKAVYGGDVPLQADGQHFKDGILSLGTETALDPTLKKGTRKLYTLLDFAALDDIGYDVAAPGTANGSVFTDKDNDGYRDAGEIGVSGVRVFIDTDKNGLADANEPSQLTTADGKYSFTNLTAGTYRVKVVLPSGYEGIKPGNAQRDIGVGAGQTKNNQDFSIAKAVAPTAKVAGTIYNDTDADGVRDSGEKGLASWRVYVDRDNDGVYDTGEPSVLTDSTGYYAIAVVPGVFRLRAVAFGGYRQTIPSAGYFDITLGTNQTASGKSFGFTASTLISGYVFKDSDKDGLKDSNEAGLSGWRVYLDDNKNGKYDSGESYTYSDSGGNWTMKGLNPRAYTVRVVQQPKYALQAPTPGYWAFTLAGGQTKTGLRFAERPA